MDVHGIVMGFRRWLRWTWEVDPDKWIDLILDTVRDHSSSLICLLETVVHRSSLSGGFSLRNLDWLTTSSSSWISSLNRFPAKCCGRYLWDGNKFPMGVTHQPSNYPPEPLATTTCCSAVSILLLKLGDFINSWYKRRVSTLAPSSSSASGQRKHCCPLWLFRGHPPQWEEERVSTDYPLTKWC